MSLFGFSPHARLRPALSLEDHYRLLADLFADFERRIRPRRVILVGFSAGADHALGFLASAASADLSIDGLLLLSPTAHSGMQTVTRSFASLPEDSGRIVFALRELGASFHSLEDWLGIHDYLVQAFGKFGQEPGALRDHARRLLDLLEEDAESFFLSFRNAIERVPRLACVFAAHEIADVDWILKRHLEGEQGVAASTVSPTRSRSARCSAIWGCGRNRWS